MIHRSFLGAIRSSPIIDKEGPIQDVAGTVSVQVTFAIVGRIAATRRCTTVCPAPIIDKERPIQDIAGAVTVQVALA